MHCPLLARVSTMPMKLGMCGFTIGAVAYFRQFRVVDAYVLFNNIPRVKDVRRFRELFET